MSEWQPIETAPKDGREVILAVEYRAGIRHGVLVGHYMPGGHCIEDHPPVAEGWYFWNGCMFDKAAKPTHWLPLPHHPAWGNGWQALAQGDMYPEGARGVPASRPVNDLDPGDCPELNLSNYDADDVAELNGWAVQADACIERLTRECNEFHTQAQHAQAEIREAHAAMDAAGFPRLQPSKFPYSLTGRVRAGTRGVLAAETRQEKRDARD